MPRLPKIEDIQNDGSSEEARKLRMPDDEFIPREAITFRTFRDRLGEAMFPGEWDGKECDGRFKGSFGHMHRSESERDADLERRHAETRKQYELAGLPMRTSREVAEHLDGGGDDTFVEVFHSFLPLTPDQRGEIDRELEPLYKKALAVKHRREAVESELQQIFWSGTLVAFYISGVDGEKAEISRGKWAVKRRRSGNFYSDKFHLHEIGVFHVDISGDRRGFTIFIDIKESEAVLANRGPPKMTRREQKKAATKYEAQNRRWNLAHELWKEKKTRKRSDIVRLITKREGRGTEDRPAIDKSLYRAETRKRRPYDQDGE